MKKYILTILLVLIASVCSAGSITDAHKSVIARMNVAESGGTVAYSEYTTDYSGTAYLYVPEPTSLTAGDMMIVGVTIDSGATITASPTGYTQIDTEYIGSTLRSYTYYKEATADDVSTWASYDSWQISAGAGWVIHLVVLSKTSGSWEVPTGASLHSINSATATSVTSDSVTCDAGATLLIFGGNDGGDETISTAPTSMTITEIHKGGSVSQVAYYQDSMSSGAVTKTIDWGTSDELTIGAVCVQLQ